VPKLGIHDRVQRAGGEASPGWSNDRRGGKGIGAVDQTLRNWVKAAEAGKLRGAGKKVVTAEQMELSRLRAENIRLKRECEILKKATGAQRRVRSHNRFREVRLDGCAAQGLWAGRNVPSAGGL
jgi:hypothetical protein